MKTTPTGFGVGVVGLTIVEGTPYAGMTRIRLRVGAALRTLSAHMTRTPLVKYAIVNLLYTTLSESGRVVSVHERASLLGYAFLFQERIFDLVTACAKRQFHPIADLFPFMQWSPIDRHFTGLRIGEYDPGRRIKRNSNLDGEVSCLIDVPAAFVNPRRRAIPRPRPLQQGVWLWLDQSVAEAYSAILA